MCAPNRGTVVWEVGKAGAGSKSSESSEEEDSEGSKSFRGDWERGPRELPRGPGPSEREKDLEKGTLGRSEGEGEGSTDEGGASLTGELKASSHSKSGVGPPSTTMSSRKPLPKAATITFQASLASLVIT